MQGELLLLLGLHLVLTALPAAAAALGLARLGVRQVPVLLAVALAASGISGLLGFWTYFGDRVLGESWSYLVVFGSVAVIAWSLYGGRLERGLLRQLATPFALWALGSAFLIFLGFLHGGTDQPVGMATGRFSQTLPSDSNLPQFFSEWFFLHGHHGTPPVYPGEWLASDRPPLQAGYVMLQRPFGWDSTGLHYQVLCVILQQLWIIGLWALLLAARVGRVTRALVMVTVLVSGLAILNGFYVWPKMLPVAMLLGAATLVMTPLWEELRSRLWAGALFAALLALAMLAHGGSVFGVIPLLLVAAYRGLPRWRWIGVAALVAIVFMAPWSAYQKYGDPPGNRLLKLTLAGVIDVDHRSTGETVVDAYREAGLGGAIHDKAENFVTMAGGGPMVGLIRNALDSGNLRYMVESARVAIFFYLFPSLGMLLLAPFAMLLARKRVRERRDWSFALACFLAVGVGAVAWGLIVFGSEAMRAVLHVGSYLLPLLAMAGAVAGLRASFPRFALWWVGCWALLSLALYVPPLQPLPGTSYSWFAAVLAAAGLAGFSALAIKSRA